MAYLLVALCVCLLVLAAPFASADPFGEAEWLRDPVFDGHETIDLYHKENVAPPSLSGPRNVHTYFRKEVDLSEAPESALLRVTGDDYYKLYVNGRFVFQLSLIHI